MTTPVEQWLPGMAITAGRLESMNQRTWLTVTNYGADASGSTDAAPSIQMALDDARDRGGAQIMVPPGVYLIGSTLRIYTNTRLTLMAGAEFRRNHGGTMILNGDADQDHGGYTGHSRITIEGGLWNMQGTTPGLTSSAMCISIGHATDIVVRDLEVRDVPGYHAIEMNSTLHGLVQNCRFRGFIDPDGTRSFSEAVQLDLAKSSGAFGGFGPYDNTPCADILITGCHFGASDTSGTTAWPRGIGSHSATIDRWHRRIRISDNAFEGLLQFAISAYNYEDLTVVGNTFDQCGSGVRLRTVIESDSADTTDADGVQTNASQFMRNLAVVGNSFRDMGDYGDAIEARGESTGTIFNLTVAGNVFDTTGPTANGVRLIYVERASITGNALANIGNTAVSMSDSIRVVVADNQITWGHGYGITSGTCNHITLNANQMHYTGKGGIWLDNSGDIQTRNNFVKGAGRDAHATYHAVRAQSSCSSLSFSANKTRPFGSGNECISGLSVTSSCSFVHRYGNDWRGAEFTGPELADDSGANTSATDLGSTT